MHDHEVTLTLLQKKRQEGRVEETLCKGCEPLRAFLSTGAGYCVGVAKR